VVLHRVLYMVLYRVLHRVPYRVLHRVLYRVLSGSERRKCVMAEAFDWLS
jgi:hypothetical protein